MNDFDRDYWLVWSAAAVVSVLFCWAFDLVRTFVRQERERAASNDTETDLETWVE